MRRPSKIAAALTLLVGVLLTPLVAFAQEPAPANTLVDIRRALGACLDGTPIAAGSRVTITFTMKRDGSIFGRPRISYAHLQGDPEAKARFLGDVERVLDSCLPLRVTPALGAAIAGRMFSITLGTEKAEPRA